MQGEVLKEVKSLFERFKSEQLSITKKFGGLAERNGGDGSVSERSTQSVVSTRSINSIRSQRFVKIKKNTT